MDSRPKLQTAAQWSRFWEAGSLTTFIGRFADNYDGDVRVFWETELDRLDHGARIVDLAAGNGALALLAAQHGRDNRKNFEITAVDYADIDPLTHARPREREAMRSVRFVGNTRIEDTGLESGRFDCAISQFGFEYGDPVASVREVARIVKPRGGRFAAIMHHEDSDIVKQAVDGLEQVDACERSALHDHIEPLLRRLDELKRAGRNPAEDQQAETFRARLNEVTDAMHRMQSRFLDPSMLPYYMKQSMAVFDPAVAGRGSLQDKLWHLEEVELFTRDYKQRMRDLVAAAGSPDGFEELRQAFAAERFAIERSEPFYFESTWFGYALVASR